MKANSKVAMAENYFRKCVMDWNAADRECSRAFGIWNDACQRRVRLAIEKNNAWGELEAARAEVTGRRNKRAIWGMNAMPQRGIIFERDAPNSRLVVDIIEWESDSTHRNVHRLRKRVRERLYGEFELEIYQLPVGDKPVYSATIKTSLREER